MSDLASLSSSETEKANNKMQQILYLFITLVVLSSSIHALPAPSPNPQVTGIIGGISGAVNGIVRGGCIVTPPPAAPITKRSLAGNIVSLVGEMGQDITRTVQTCQQARPQPVPVQPVPVQPVTGQPIPVQPVPVQPVPVQPVPATAIVDNVFRGIGNLGKTLPFEVKEDSAEKQI
ncbi:hypothetical protein BKA69DRAFT_1128658 [Paraphysoderma sedebokerense]|nr:hypothetical protein BKA69DRAFT_1128658 [Paraphysoderma sedebokerense]